MDSHFRAFLRNYGQTLSPTVMVGRNGADDGVAAHLENALRTRELVKVRCQAHKEDAEAMGLSLARAVGGILVTRVGFTLLIYRDGEEHEMERLYGEREKRNLRR